MHVAPLYRLYSAKTHVFVSGMRGVAFISTGRGKAGHSEGEGEKKKLGRTKASSKWWAQARAEGRTGGQGGARENAGQGWAKVKMCDAGQNSG